MWYVRANSDEVIHVIVQTRAGVPVYVCREAYSHEHGWVEGALNTTELMLTTCFGLKSHLHSDASDKATVKTPAGVTSSLKAPERAAHR